jgi:hypothetical protein
MTRIAVYECPCCGRRVSLAVDAGTRPSRRIDCKGWCQPCGGACLDVARCTGIEQDGEPVPEPTLWAKTARFVRASSRLDLPDVAPQDLAW